MKSKRGNGLTPLFPQEEATPDNDIMVDLTTPVNVEEFEGSTISDMGDGTTVVELEEDEDECCEAQEYDDSDSESHTANLAEFVDETTLNLLAQTIIEEVEIDKKSREPWNNLYRTGIETIDSQIEQQDRREPFDGASTVSYPMLSTAVINFQARALSELYPAGGPVKTSIKGKETEEKRAQAKRVTDHMNYQITEEDDAFFDEADQMLFFLPISGSAFKKVYWDTYSNTPVSRFVRPTELIVPYTATSLATAERYTHELLISQNDMKKQMNNGFYRDIVLVLPSMEKGGEYNAVDSVDDKADNKTPSYDDNDYRHTVYESHRYCDLKGFEHKDEETGEPSGVAIPYIVSVDLDTRKVLSIRRNWKEGDMEFKKRVWFIHFKYLPGVGFYGFGLMHIIGGLQKAATGASRIILDSSAFASLQGGFRSKDVKSKAGIITLTPGEWKDVDMTAEELQKAFYTPPFKEPSPALSNFLQFIVEAGQRVTSTTESMVGDASNNGPVGTTLALIEQGSKVYSGIHKRLHNAAKKEYVLRAELNYDNLNHDEEYPYEVEGDSRFIKGSDYDERVDVVPASDPNVFSSTQRIAKAQTLLQISESRPDLYNAYRVHRRMLEAVEISDIDEVLPDPDHIARLDPITENECMMTGKPVKAHPDQDHAAHIAVHMSFLTHPSFGGNPNIAQMITGPMIAHLAQHKAYEYRDLMEQSGAIVVPVDISTSPQEAMQDMDPEQERLMSQVAAQAVQQFAQMQGASVDDPNQQQQDPEAMKAEAAIAAKAKITDADIEIKNRTAEADQTRQDAITEREEARKDAITQADIARKAKEAKFNKVIGVMNAATDDEKSDKKADR